MKQSYKSNFDKGFLLLGLPIEVYFETENPIIIITPTIEDMMKDEITVAFLELLQKTELELPNGNTIKVENSLQMLKAQNKFFKYEKFQQVFNKLFPNLRIEDEELKFEDYILNDVQFDILLKMVLVSCNYITFEEFENGKKEEENDEVNDFFKRQKELEKKLNKAKAKKENDRFEFDKALIAVLSYYPQYQIKDIIKLNYYTFYQLFEFALKREHQFVTDVAAGNGLLSKDSKWQPLF